jgi:hypothetical protein
VTWKTPERLEMNIFWIRRLPKWVNLDQTGPPRHVRFALDSNGTSDIEVGPVRADIVAKVVLHKASNIPTAADAFFV